MLPSLAATAWLSRWKFSKLFLGLPLFTTCRDLSPTANWLATLPAGGDYFAFALVGFAFFDYLTVSLSAFDSSIMEAQQNGTLEAMLVTETPLTTILMASAAYPFVLLALRTLVYLAWGVLLFHFPLRNANWAGAIVILVTSILAFAGLGIISTSYLLLFKRGNPARWLIVGASSLLGGIMYPVSVLPAPLQWLARLIPVTYSLEGMRQAVLAGAGFAQLWPSVRALIVFAVVLLPLSSLVFAWALRRTKITGTLTHL